jgi:molybdopterin converting factor small subunit
MYKIFVVIIKEKRKEIQLEVQVKLFATFREGRFSEQKKSFPEGSTISDVVKDLGIDEREVAIAMVNGDSSELDRELKDGDTLSLFPPIGAG